MSVLRSILNVSELVDLAPEPTLLDVRWSLGGGGREAYAVGHLPGAVFVDLDGDLCGPPGAGGRHPLPEPAALQVALRRLGLREGRPVVVYDAGGPNPTGAAARAWWTLRWAGVSDVRVLDGGYAAWVAAGRPTTTAEPTVEAGDVVVRPGGMPVWEPGPGAGVGAGEGAEPGRETPVLLDARVPARFRGETEPVDPVAGHVPGAVNQPASSTVDDQGRLLDPERLRAAFAALGIGPDTAVGAYCGSGVTAAQTVLALVEAGHRPALYVGSWSHWITDGSRPVATGKG